MKQNIFMEYRANGQDFFFPVWSLENATTEQARAFVQEYILARHQAGEWRQTGPLTAVKIENEQELTFVVRQDGPTPSLYAVVQVDPDCDGTDESKGITLLTDLSFEAAKAAKETTLRSLLLSGWHIEDRWKADPPSWSPQDVRSVGLLVCPVDCAPPLKGVFEEDAI